LAAWPLPGGSSTSPSFQAPEPGSLALLAVGGLGTAGLRRRKA